MEIYFMFAAAVVVMIVSFIAITKGLLKRVGRPGKAMDERVSRLEERIEALEVKEN